MGGMLENLGDMTCDVLAFNTGAESKQFSQLGKDIWGLKGWSALKASTGDILLTAGAFQCGMKVDDIKNIYWAMLANTCKKCGYERENGLPNCAKHEDTCPECQGTEWTRDGWKVFDTTKTIAGNSAKNLAKRWVSNYVGNQVGTQLTKYAGKYSGAIMQQYFQAKLREKLGLGMQRNILQDMLAQELAGAGENALKGIFGEKVMATAKRCITKNPRRRLLPGRLGPSGPPGSSAGILSRRRQLNSNSGVSPVMIQLMRDIIKCDLRTLS